MKTRTFSLIGLLAGACILFSCSPTPPVGRVQGKKEAVPIRVMTFGLEEVKLLDGLFKHVMELDMKVLLNYEPDRMLSKFYKEAGLTQRLNITMAGRTVPFRAIRLAIT